MSKNSISMVLDSSMEAGFVDQTVTPLKPNIRILASFSQIAPAAMNNEMHVKIANNIVVAKKTPKDVLSSTENVAVEEAKMHSQQEQNVVSAPTSLNMLGWCPHGEELLESENTYWQRQFFLLNDWFTVQDKSLKEAIQQWEAQLKDQTQQAKEIAPTQKSNVGNGDQAKESEMSENVPRQKQKSILTREDAENNRRATQQRLQKLYELKTQNDYRKKVVRYKEAEIQQQERSQRVGADWGPGDNALHQGMVWESVMNRNVPQQQQPLSVQETAENGELAVQQHLQLLDQIKVHEHRKQAMELLEAQIRTHIEQRRRDQQTSASGAQTDVIKNQASAQQACIAGLELLEQDQPAFSVANEVQVNEPTQQDAQKHQQK